ncbi:MAG: AAA family ATPase [Mediterranea sp.]|jgi:GTPase SAR1 family protein|nr:AAA family ATPase [Mediterranea sp.]
MKQLFTTFYKHLERTSDYFERYLLHEIKWNSRLIAITGARGCGKTTLLFQHIKKEYGKYPEKVQIGNVRETFFFNQVRVRNTVIYVAETDFNVSQKYYFEIGGKSKGQKQINNLPDAYLALDDIEIGFRNEIPIWLFGMLY